MITQIKNKIEQLGLTIGSKIEMSEELYQWLVNNNYTEQEIAEIQAFINGDIIDLMIDEFFLDKVNEKLLLKADKTYVDDLFDSIDVVDISGKADLTYVNSQLDLKADKANVYTKIETDNFLDLKQNNVSLQDKLNMVSQINDVYNGI